MVRERMPVARRLGAVLISLALVPVTAAGASSGVAGASAPAAVKIGGPNKLRAAKVLKFPIFVSADSFVRVRGKLRLPGPNLPVNLSGTIRQGRPRQVKLTLNTPAKVNLKDHFRVASLKIVVTARNQLTNIKHTARKTFRFKL